MNVLPEVSLPNKILILPKNSSELASSLKALTDHELIQSARGAIETELNATTNVVRHFAEIYERKTYAVMGYSSMQRFAIEEMRIDKASAQRRVNAMLLAIAVPEVLEMIDGKQLFLQSAADIQTFLNKERGARRPYSRERQAELVKASVGKSTRKVQQHLASLNPACDFKESKRYVSADRLQITYTTSVDIEKKLDRLKEVIAHVNPYMSREELIDYVAEIALDKLDPKRKAQRPAKRAAKKVGDVSHVDNILDAAVLVSKELTASMSEAGPSGSGPAQVLLPDYEIREEAVGSYGEIQLAVEFYERGASIRKASRGNGLRCDSSHSSFLRENTSPYEERADRGRFSRLSRREGRPSLRGLAFRRPAEKSTSPGF